jgi:hypothetical protein
METNIGCRCGVARQRLRPRRADLRRLRRGMTYSTCARSTRTLCVLTTGLNESMRTSTNTNRTRRRDTGSAAGSYMLIILKAFVRFDDVLDQFVPHDVGFLEILKAHAFDAAEHVADFHEAAHGS